MKTHNELIYHCEHCGRVVHQEPEVPPPDCCGHSMTQAAAKTVFEDESDGNLIVEEEFPASPPPRKPK
jgi:hypothetical protein